MKQDQIKVGEFYLARVSGLITTVRVDRIRDAIVGNSRWPTGGKSTRTIQVYDVTNMATGRKLTFQSATKFRKPVRERHPKIVGKEEAQKAFSAVVAESKPEESFHVQYQRTAAFEACRLLRTLDDGVREAVLKHYRDADLEGSKGRILKAIQDYAGRLAKATTPEEIQDSLAAHDDTLRSEEHKRGQA